MPALTRSNQVKHRSTLVLAWRVTISQIIPDLRGRAAACAPVSAVPCAGATALGADGMQSHRKPLLHSVSRAFAPLACLNPRPTAVLASCQQPCLTSPLDLLWGESLEVSLIRGGLVGRGALKRCTAAAGKAASACSTREMNAVVQKKKPRS